MLMTVVNLLIICGFDSGSVFFYQFVITSLKLANFVRVVHNAVIFD